MAAIPSAGPIFLTAALVDVAADHHGTAVPYYVAHGDAGRCPLIALLVFLLALTPVQ